VSHTRGLNHEKRRRNWEPTSIMHTLVPIRAFPHLPVKYPSFARYCLPNWLNSFSIAPKSLQLLATASAPRLGRHIRELAMAKMRIESAPTAASLSMIDAASSFATSAETAQNPESSREEIVGERFPGVSCHPRRTLQQPTLVSRNAQIQ